MVDAPPESVAFGEAIRAAGGQTALAKLVGVTQGAIWQRFNSGKPVAPLWVLPIERELKISRHVLRPDLYPIEDPSSAADAPLEQAR